MNEQKLKVKSTDVLVIQTDGKEREGTYRLAARLTNETKAIVLVLGPGESIRQFPEEEARKLLRLLQERFG